MKFLIDFYLIPHQLFTLNAFFVEFHYLPFTNLTGRPLYNYLMIESKKEKIGYKTFEGKRKSIQTVLNAYD